MNLSVVILAAGQGTRMRSELPKVLHKIAGVSMLERVVRTVQGLSPSSINIVYGHKGDVVKSSLGHLDVNWVEQTEQLGTGHAVLQAMPHITDDQKVLILYGDVPVISKETLEDLIQTTPEDGVGVVTAHFEQPDALGRIVRDHSGNFVGIVEYKDATAEQRMIKEINSGLYLVPAKYLRTCLPKLSNSNSQEEYYLTDVLGMAVTDSVPVVTVVPKDNEEVMGVNDRIQQAQLERYYQSQQAIALMQQGVTIIDPQRLDVRGTLSCGRDVVLDVNVVIEGDVSLGDRTHVGPNTCIYHSQIGADVVIKPNSVLERATVDDHASIGPFARLRPEAHIKENARIGNFVEIKKATIGKESKVGHLTYIGDTTVGEAVNIGAGTITCNYDGVNKHHTQIGDGAFIGSGTQLVAPVSVGENAVIGAGSVITKPAPAEKLSLSRSKQQSINGWSRPTKKES